MELLPWTHLDGPAIAGSFISRRVQPCQKRVHAGYEYQGSTDQTRMHPNRLHDDKIKWRIVDLFSLANPSYHPLSIIVHLYIRPAPKVSLASVSYVNHIVVKNFCCNPCGPYGVRCMAWKGTCYTCPWRPGWTTRGAWSPHRGSCSNATPMSMSRRETEHQAPRQTLAVGERRSTQSPPNTRRRGHGAQRPRECQRI
jgi:hypothetical protein